MNFPLVYVCVTGMVLSFLSLFFNKGYEKANRYLAGFIFVSSSFVLYHFLGLYGTSLEATALLSGGFPSLFYLAGPFAFFYVRSILRDDATLSKKDWGHFLLFFLIFLGSLPYVVGSWDAKMQVSKVIHSNEWKLDSYKINRLVPIWLNHAVKVHQLLVYMILMWMEFKKILKRWKSSENNPNFNIVKKWLVIFCSIATLISVLFATLIIMYHFYNLKSDFLKTAFYVLQLAGYAYFSMIFFLLLFPQVLYGLPVSNSIPPEPIDERSTQTSLFSDEYLKEVELKLNEYVQQSFVLKQECSLSHLTQNTRVPLHHLSYYFSQVLLVRFPDWRNRLRIHHAVNLMIQGKASEMTLEALATECGFKHRSTFIEAFKKESGQTPSEYLKNLKASTS